MKFTRTIAARLKAACEKTCGGKRQVEVGCRVWPDMPATPNVGFNFLLWRGDHDIDELTLASDLVGQDIPDDSGWNALDCYCYTLGHDGKLDCNVYVLLNASGAVEYASQDDRGHAAAIDTILRACGHAGYANID